MFSFDFTTWTAVSSEREYRYLCGYLLKCNAKWNALLHQDLFHVRDVKHAKVNWLFSNKRKSIRHCFFHPT